MGMVAGVFFALVCTGIAHFSTEYHKIAGEIRTPRIKPTTKGADVGAVAAQFDAGRHIVAFAVGIVHFQTSRRAAFAGFGAGKAGIWVRVIVLHRFHNRCCHLVDRDWSVKITTHSR